jgi:hypothetical protein
VLPLHREERPEPGRAGPHRFADADGVEWTATEVDGAQVPAARGARCLVFESAAAFRRVWQYLADWRTLSPEALLSWQR